jgi:hypothetical protein
MRKLKILLRYSEDPIIPKHQRTKHLMKKQNKVKTKRMLQ